MGTRLRVRLYKGVVEAEAEQRFRADAAWAVRQGWYPTERQWDGMALRVVYAHGPHGPWDTSERPGLVRRLLRRAR
jgi:hypothetical protein